MKAIILFIFFTILTVPTVFGQIKIGDNPQNIDPTSVLELESTSKVLVITRVSTLEMEAITPQRGGMVYNTDTECINYYDGTQWINLCDAVNFTITNDPVINGRSTIEITESAGGYNLEVAKNSILGDNIIDGGIGPDDIQDNSITQDKLAAESVGSSELRQNSVGTEEIRDGSIAPADIANFLPGQVLTTDENGIVQWQDSDELYDLTFNKLDNTLTISRSTTTGVSTIDLAALVGSDDQQLSLDNNILSIENNPNTYDLSTYLQQLSINPATNEISLTNGGTITLPAAAVEVDAIVGNEILNATDGTLVRNGDGTNANPYTLDVSPVAIGTAELANNSVTTAKLANNSVGTANIINGTIGTVDIAPSAAAPVNTQILTTSTAGIVGWIDIPAGTVNTDSQNLTLTGNTLAISGGNDVDLSTITTATSTLNDEQIFVGNSLNTPIGVDVGGDLTMNNIGEFTIVDNIIDSDNIINNTITLQDLNQNGATNGQIIKWDETLNAGLGAWAIANDNTGGTGANVTDTDANDGLSDYSNTLGYNIIVDDNTIEIVGDALQVKEDAIGIDQLNPMGATTTGQILKWNQTSSAWELGTDVTGSAVTDIDTDDALTDFNATTGYSVKVDDTTIEIAGDALRVKENAIGLDQLNPMGATTTGQILKWNQTTLTWELGTDIGGTLADGQVLIGNATDAATPQTLSGDATIDNTGVVTITADAVENTMIAANVAGNGLIKNITSGALDIIPGTVENQILKWNNTTEIWELGTDVGGALADGQVLIGNATDAATPQTLSGDATIDNTGVVTITADAVENTMIAANVAGNGLAKNITSGALEIIPGSVENQILKWNNTTEIWELGTDVGGELPAGQVLIGNATGKATPQTLTGDATIDIAGVVTIEEDAVDNTMIDPNVAGDGLTQNLTSGALDIIPGTAANQILKWNNTTTAWELGTNDAELAGTTGSIFFADTDGSPTENNDWLNWDNTTNLFRIGPTTTTNTIFRVNGVSRFQGIINSAGSATTPSYRFVNDTDNNTGMYFPAQDQLGFSTGGLQTLLLRQSATNGLEIIAEGSLELTEQLLDENGSPGNEGEVLTATTSGTEWKEPQIFAMGKVNGGNSINISGIQSISGGAGINTVNFISPRIDADYIIQLTVVGDNRIYVTSQTTNGFTVEIRDALSNNLMPAIWYFTLSDFE
ncbi:beta strand repeat-containing protein [Maribacter sp. Hel_I_7]|uniref:beta strand repeat-containing protein n=1 Tax=Maribacter sp. Hel_I_7 TaxID=1249997 RepID=UPI0004790008|nr:hypothetical protein [Maribacter sp. Hel_I_7]